GQIGDLGYRQAMVVRVPDKLPGEARGKMSAEVFQGCPHHRKGEDERQLGSPVKPAQKVKAGRKEERAIQGQPGPSKVHTVVCDAQPLQRGGVAKESTGPGSEVDLARGSRRSHQAQKRDESEPR